MAYLGKTPSQAVRSRYYFTASGGETSLSGTDDNSNTLTFTDGNYVDVSLNGVALVAGTDYNTTTANTIGGLTALVASDVVEVVVYDTFSVFSGEFRGDISLGDNVKAKFGASDDLQIFHDGTNSYIADVGTGGLYFRASSYAFNNAANTETITFAQEDGAVSLYYDGAAKLATTSTGADITGTLTADGLTVDAQDAINVNGYQPFITLKDSNDANKGFRLQTASGNTLFSVDATGGGTFTEAMRIDSSGNLLVGKTSTAFGSVGARLSSTDNHFTTDGGAVADFNRLTSVGAIVNFYKDGTTVGSIGVAATDDVYFAGGTGSTKGIYLNDNGVLPATTGGSASDATVDLGNSVLRWKDLYLSGKAYLNTTSGAQLILQTDATRAFVGTNTNHPLIFDTNGSERLRIENGGDVEIKTASKYLRFNSPSSTFDFSGQPSGTDYLRLTTSSSGNFFFYADGSLYNTTGTYGTISDLRLKENVVDATSKLDELMQLRVVNYNFRTSPDTKMLGFIAQEVEQVFPSLVEAGEEVSGEEPYKSIKTSVLVPMLVKAIQEQQATIETLETEMTSVKARLDALEAN